MDTQVEEIKSRIEIIDLIGQYLTLTKAGRNYKALCPFHQEKTPSFMVNQEMQIFKCFGCSESGDVFDFVMKMEGMEFPQALELLADKAGVELKKSKIQNPKSKITDDGISKARLLEINRRCRDFFHKSLYAKTGQIALDYLHQRGLTEETIKSWQIGWAPGRPVIEKKLTAAGFRSREINLAGQPERLAGRIIFPINDILGQTNGFSGRALLAEQQPKYWNTPETPIFHKSRLLFGLDKAREAIKDADEAIIVEGQMDVLASHQAGVKNAVASSGTSLTTDHLKIIQRYTGNLLFCLDADTAGQAASQRGLKLAWQAGANVKMIVLPTKIKDPCELAINQPEEWRRLAKKPISAAEWYWQQAVATAGKSMDKLIELFLPTIKLLHSPLERDRWLNKLSRVAGASRRVVEEMATKTQNLKTKTPNKEEQSQKQEISLPKQLLMILVWNKELREKYQEIYKPLWAWYNKNQPREAGEKRRKILLLEAKQLYQDYNQKELGHETATLIQRLREQRSQKIKVDFAQRIAAAEAGDDRTQVKELLVALQKKLIIINDQ